MRAHVKHKNFAKSLVNGTPVAERETNFLGGPVTNNFSFFQPRQLPVINNMARV
jgi:hypothetical protein